jgi:hypothetical protein
MAQSYYNPTLFKTDAPVPVIYDVFKKYKKENYADVYLKNVKEDTYHYKILEKEIKVNPVFAESTEKDSGQKYMPHPFKNWGPKSRAKELK